MELPLDDRAWQDKEIAVTGWDRATVYVPGQPAEFAQQKTTGEGVPLWDIFCTVQEGRQATNFKVRIASVAEPGIEGVGRIRFGGFRASTYPDGPRNIVTFTADTFVVGDAPSARAQQSSGSSSQPPVPSGEKKAA
jgi:hypothetical protein